MKGTLHKDRKKHNASAHKMYRNTRDLSGIGLPKKTQKVSVLLRPILAGAFYSRLATKIILIVT